MKKISFPLVVILLICIIITLIGYNTLTIRKESQKYQELQQKYQNQPLDETTHSNANTPTIYCIGDSLTIGAKSSSYPTALSSATNFSVNKFGGAQDQTQDIAIRMGKIKIYTNNITIPETVTPVNLKIYDKDNNVLNVLKGKGSNFTTVEIAGISGKLKYNATKKTHTFTRDQNGVEKVITKLTQIKSEIPTFEKNNVAIIFTGTYDPQTQNGIFKTITYQRAIINQLKTKNYIVVSLTSKRRLPIVDDMNKVLKEEHKEHFLDFRDYLLNDGIKDAKMTLTAQDKKDLQKGYIPSSFLQADMLNGNAKFNQLLAEQITKKMIDLKYINKNDIK